MAVDDGTFSSPVGAAAVAANLESYRSSAPLSRRGYVASSRREIGGIGLASRGSRPLTDKGDFHASSVLAVALGVSYRCRSGLVRGQCRRAAHVRRIQD